MPDSLTFSVPLPPVSLRSNNRAHWRRRKKDADEYSRDIMHVWYARPVVTSYRQKYPWTAAKVTYTWRYCGNAPDHGNLGGNTKVLQDCLQMAPKTGAGANRYYLGIIENDSGLTCEYKLERVATRAEQGVVVKIERLA